MKMHGNLSGEERIQMIAHAVEVFKRNPDMTLKVLHKRFKVYGIGPGVLREAVVAEGIDLRKRIRDNALFRD